jgi:hypothetical protein
MLASSPAGEISPRQIDDLTDLALEILNIQKEMKQILLTARQS